MFTLTNISVYLSIVLFFVLRLQVASKIEFHFPDLFLVLLLHSSHVNCRLSCMLTTALLTLYLSTLSVPSSAGIYRTTDLEMVILWTVPTAV